MAARSTPDKPPRRSGGSAPPLAMLILSGEGGATTLLAQERREAAEAALPPAAGALEVLRASRGVHRAETALRRAATGEDLSSLRSALEQAEEVLRVVLERLGEAADDAS